MFSDNGTNFTGTGNLLRGINWKRITEYSAVKKIEWRFNPPSAAWWGGWWERLVRSVKEILRKVLGRACLTSDELYTTLCDCEAIVNSRPITYLSEDSGQLAPLTPSMFIQDVQESGLPDLDQIEESNLKARLRYRQKLRADLRCRFRSEYLGQLSRASYSSNDEIKIKIGDVVLIGNESQKRLDWPLGRVIEIILGRDGKVRVVRVKTANGELVRPVQRLYPLEISTPGEMEALSKSANETKESYEENSLPEDQPSPSKIEEVDESDKEDTSSEVQTKLEVRTRSGRRVNAPNRLDL
ncbi:uncharacterized protein [Temnothorax longispinosus]|uniref:uncharacterized protein n=1 Tax=Temnothorax longispinosus TaxID=300112 RepID=UPI003A99C0C9